MPKKTLTIQNKLGLHARAAMKLTDTASRFESKVTITCNGRTADAKSIMEAMVVGASFGHDVDLYTEGADSHDAMAALEELIMNRFGESE